MDNNRIKGNLYLKKNKDEFIFSFHSWIFSGAVEKIESKEKLRNGDIIKIYNYNKQFLGYAFYEKPEQIVARIFYFGQQELLNLKQYFIEQFNKIYFRKKKLFPDSNAFRFLHSESDGMPGIICDVFNTVAIIQLDDLIPMFLIEVLIEFLRSKNYYVVIKKQNELEWKTDEIKELEFIENDIKFFLNLTDFQKTGYYLDQRLNKKKLRFFVKNKIVLDAFCYTGGFGLNALMGDAEKVNFVDAKNIGDHIKNNILLNGFSTQKGEFIKEDVFLYLKNVPDSFYDIMIIDPPAFVKTKSKLNEGVKGYIMLNQLAIKKIKSTGYIFTFSCSQHIDKELFRKIIFLAAKNEKRSVYIMEYLSQAPDHTINIFHPEGEYLKGMIVYVE